MAYTILRTDGTVLARVADASINSTATSVTFLGRDFTGYGQYYNQDLVTLLTNSARSTPPVHPTQGELWYDVSSKSLIVYDGNFKKIGSFAISDTRPVSLEVGDFWYDNANEILNFYTPYGLYSLSSYQAGAPTGWVSPLVSVIDNNNVTRSNVSLLFNKDPSTALGVLSDSTFVASTATTQQYLTASSQTNTNIIAGLNIFGGIQATGDVTVGGSIHTASTTGTPTNTSTPAKWLKMVVGGANYYVPLYQ